MKQKYKGTVCHRLEETKEKQLNAVGILEQNIQGERVKWRKSSKICNLVNGIVSLLISWVYIL